MKHFVKGNEPVALTEWKALANEEWQPTYGDLSGKVKEAVKESLLAEQGHICCYCERRLSVGDLHIEHLQPQSSAAVDPLDTDCEEHFSYTHDGRIQPTPQNSPRAQETIHTLGLGLPKLNEMRGQAIAPFYTTIEQLFGQYV